jgi:hypothetical protein
MGKQDLINQISKDRTRWPAEARICASLWSLTRKLRSSGLMEDYIEKKLSLDDIEVLLQERDNSNIIQDILDLKQDVFTYCTPCIRSDVWKNYEPHHFQVLNELGTLLASSQWWERYETITATMGVECVLSIRTAESLFKRDPLAKDIKTTLKKLVEDNKC